MKIQVVKKVNSVPDFRCVWACKEQEMPSSKFHIALLNNYLLEDNKKFIAQYFADILLISSITWFLQP